MHKAAFNTIFCTQALAANRHGGVLEMSVGLEGAVVQREPDVIVVVVIQVQGLGDGGPPGGLAVLGEGAQRVKLAVLRQEPSLEGAFGRVAHEVSTVGVVQSALGLEVGSDVLERASLAAQLLHRPHNLAHQVGRP